MSNITVVGLGLIGGSFAKALSTYTSHTVFGIDRSSRVMDDALECGAVSQDLGTAALPCSDYIVLALYPDGCVDFIRKNLALIPKGAIVFDLCGVKKSICEVLFPLSREHGFHFVGAHPMAGKEQNGFDFSDADLFKGASFLMTPSPDEPKPAQRVKELALSVGFGRVVETTPSQHDSVIAFTSQLPHALAAAYVHSPQCPLHSGFSAGSYRDVSRVALINENLWPQLFLQNKEALTCELDRLISELTVIREAVAQSDEKTLTQKLKQARERKEIYG